MYINAEWDKILRYHILSWPASLWIQQTLPYLTLLSYTSHCSNLSKAVVLCMTELPTQCEPFSQEHDGEVAAVESGLAARHKAGGRAEAELKFVASFCIHLLIGLKRRENSKEKITAKR